jgi:hypothetical protein
VERIRVLGVRVAKLEPTQEALDHGLVEAFGPDEVEMVGARGVATTISMEAREPGWRPDHGGL